MKTQKEQSEHNIHLYHKVQPFLQFHRSAVIFSHHHEHQPQYPNLQNYQHPPLPECYPLNYVLFGLKKILLYQNNFIQPRQKRILQAAAPGITSLAIKLSWYGLGCCWLLYGYNMKRVNYKYFLVFGGILFFQKMSQRLLDKNRQMIKNELRLPIAQKYLKKYGKQFFHEAIDPRTNMKQFLNK